MSKDINKFAAVELQQINNADDLHISPFREDGGTYGTPTWIWAVVVAGELYVRAFNGVASRWYTAALNQKEGRIIAAGMTKDVSFQPVEEENLNQRIDEAYKTKYQKSPYLKHMISSKAKSATIKISPIRNSY